MNTRRNIGQKRGVAVVGDNQVPHQAPAKGVAILVNPAGLTDVEVRNLWTKWHRPSTCKIKP